MQAIPDCHILAFYSRPCCLTVIVTACRAGVRRYERYVDFLLDRLREPPPQEGEGEGAASAQWVGQLSDVLLRANEFCQEGLSARMFRVRV